MRKYRKLFCCLKWPFCTTQITSNAFWHISYNSVRTTRYSNIVDISDNLDRVPQPAMNASHYLHSILLGYLCM